MVPPIATLFPVTAVNHAGMSVLGLMRGVMLMIDLVPETSSTVLTIKNQYFLAPGAAEVGAKHGPMVT